MRRNNKRLIETTSAKGKLMMSRLVSKRLFLCSSFLLVDHQMKMTFGPLVREREGTKKGFLVSPPSFCDLFSSDFVSTEACIRRGLTESWTLVPSPSIPFFNLSIYGLVFKGLTDKCWMKEREGEEVQECVCRLQGLSFFVLSLSFSRRINKKMRTKKERGRQRNHQIQVPAHLGVNLRVPKNIPEETN